LKQLKGRPAFLIEGGNFAIEGDSFSRQQFQGNPNATIPVVLKKPLANRVPVPT
jgi:hypothetical protein